MDKHQELTITNELTREQVEQAAEIHYDAFKYKVKYLLLFTGSRKKAVSFLTRALTIRNGLYVLKADRVIGIVGLQRDKEAYIDATFRLFKKTFGLFGASWRFVAFKAYKFFVGSPEVHELRIDWLAVSGEARGLGVGSYLLQKVQEIASDMGKTNLVLEVVDTNPQARKLYERIGFVHTDTKKFGLITSKAGFKALHYMNKSIGKSK